MTGFGSPDLPAYWCYAVVALVGALHARSTVNQLLKVHPDHWAFPQTWALFLAHAVLPLVLFWFLDYTAVIHDTSLFAALIIALGYKQVFSGGVQGIKLPGQSDGFWKPFQTWVGAVAVTIGDKNKRLRDRFEEAVRRSLATKPGNIDQFETLVRSHAEGIIKPEDEKELEKLKQEEGANADGKRVRKLWNLLRRAEPKEYGYYLWKSKLIGGVRYWLWRGRGRATLVIVFVLVLVAGPIALASWTLGSDPGRGDSLLLRYHHWRYVKTTATPRDRFRSQEFLGNHLDQLRERDEADEATRAEAVTWVAPLVRELRYEELTTDMADRILRLVVDHHSRQLDRGAIPDLIESLHTANCDIRLRIQQVLVTLAEADWAANALPATLVGWTPAAEDTPGEIAGHVDQWKAWWDAARAGLGPPTASANP